MLQRIKFLEGYVLWTKEGRYGKVHEFYFDKNNWSIRFLVADLGHWLQNKYVLIDSIHFGIPEKALKFFVVQLYKEQLENSPDVHVLGPALRPDYDLTSYFTWPNYFDYSQQALDVKDYNENNQQKGVKDNQDVNLVSSKEIESFRIHATDDLIGHVDDLLVDDIDWKIKKFIVNTRNLFVGGKKVLLEIEQVDHIDLNERSIFVKLNTESIKHCPEVHYYI